MKINKKTALLITTSTLAATLWCVPSARGDGSLAAIPPLGTDVSNEARAITSDGKYVVGLSGTNAGFFYDVLGGTVVQPMGPDYIVPLLLTGVAYRTDTNQTPAVNQVVASGTYYPGTGNNKYAVWMTTDGGASWDYSYLNASTPKKPFPCMANGLATGPGDAFFAIWTDEGTASGDNWGINVGQLTGLWNGGATPASLWGYKAAARPNIHQMNAIAGNGRAVGWRTVNLNANTSCYLDIADWAGAGLPSIWGNGPTGPWGLDGTVAGQAYSVSSDGTVIFGVSPRGGVTMPTNFPFKATFNTTFPGAATQLSTNPLPVLANSTALVQTANPYVTNTPISTNMAMPFGCTPNGKYAVGVNFQNGNEQAVMWDTSDVSPANWTVNDLTALASANSILGNFTNLSRAYSVGTNATGKLVVVGVGSYTPDAGVTYTNRAFVMVVPTLTAPFVPPKVSVSTTPQKYTFTVASVTGKTYSLVASTSVSAALNTWTTVGATQSGNGSSLTFTDLNPSDAKKYYRIKITTP